LRKFFSAALLILTCFVFTGCKKEENQDFKVVTSCYPVYIMTINLTKDIPGVETVNMSESNTGCLHNFQLRSEDLKKIEKSSAFIINGAGMESFLDRVKSELPGIRLIDSSEGIELIKDDCLCEENVHQEHCHHEFNPHIWMSVSGCIKQVENIKSGLIKYDPYHAQMYEKNALEYISKLENLKQEISLKLKDVKSRDIITFHEAFPYFAKEFNLNIVGVINHEPGEEPPIREVREIIELIKEKNIKSIFVEPQYPQSTASTIAKETGAKIYVLDPVVTGDFSQDSYIDTMEKNLDVLCEALK